MCKYAANLTNVRLHSLKHIYIQAWPYGHFSCCVQVKLTVQALVLPLLVS